jgi:uncharacterized protein (DUF1697 family)
MAPVVAFLRAVNIGGRWIKMADLRTLFAELGFADAATYVQSGNVVFTAPDGDRPLLKATIEAAVAARFGFHSETILRTADELDALIAGNPFPDMAETDPAHLVVHFFAAPPSAADTAALAMEWKGPEEWRLSGHHLVITYPQGIGRSELKLRLKTPTTARNWKSVKALAEMARAHRAAESPVKNSQRRKATVKSRPLDSASSGEVAMAKGQMKSNKEKRKPKADKSKPKTGNTPMSAAAASMAPKKK